MAAPDPTPRPNIPRPVQISPLPTFSPDLYTRAWASVPHPTLPLLATAHARAVTVFSLRTLTRHSALTGGHARSVRCAAWKPGLPPHRLCLVTGSFDATAGLWRWDGDRDTPLDGGDGDGGGGDAMEVEMTGRSGRRRRKSDADEGEDGADNRPGGGDEDDDWEFTLVLEGHENEVKSASFSPSGQFLATCGRDKSVWIWEDVGADEADDEWETVAVLNEHDGDVKAVAWCPAAAQGGRRGRYGADALVSASYDNTARVWREDGDGEWTCVAVLEGHAGTVWGVQWEPKPREGRAPRLLTWSADATLRIWTLREDEDPEEDERARAAEGAANPLLRSGLGGIPNTMRRSIREDWDCTEVLPKGHTRDIYSASWSAASGMIASTGSDGIIAVYGEDKADESGDEKLPVDSTRDADMTGSKPRTNGALEHHAGRWRILGTITNGHGPYEINHVTWCKRFDPASERPGQEEMLVTTGDDGIIRPWQIS